MSPGVCVASAVWNDTLRHLHHCGRGRLECVVLWTGPVDTPGVVDAAVHPEHAATPFSYRLEAAWLHRFHVELYRERRTIRAQVHTHQGRAFHSATDDAYPAVNVAGFLSLVLPRFARAPVSLADIWLAELTPTGGWRRVLPTDRIDGIAP